MALLKDTLYAKYISEREGSEILENDNAFIIYKISGDECFMIDMKANRGATRGIIQQMVNIAKQRNCKVITANIQIADKRAMHNLLASKSEGFKLIRAHNDVLLVAKNIGDT